MSIDAIILTDRQTDRQTDRISLSFCHTFLHTGTSRSRPPEAGLPEGLSCPARDSRPQAVFLCVSYERCEVRVFYRYG